MGTDIQAILQVKGTLDDYYTTIIEDCLYFPSSLAREFHALLIEQSIGTVGVPESARSILRDHVDGVNGPYYIGEYGMRTFSLQDFGDIETNKDELGDRLIISTSDTAINIEFGNEEDYSLDSQLNKLKGAFEILFSDRMFAGVELAVPDYRFIIGFGS